MDIRRRRFNRKHPAPPKTPPGKVWMTRVKHTGFSVVRSTGLVPASELEAASKREMDAFDSLPAEVREQMRGTGRSAQEHEITEKAKANARTASLGIGRAF